MDQLVHILLPTPSQIALQFWSLKFTELIFKKSDPTSQKTHCITITLSWETNVTAKFIWNTQNHKQKNSVLYFSVKVWTYSAPEQTECHSVCGRLVDEFFEISNPNFHTAAKLVPHAAISNKKYLRELFKIQSSREVHFKANIACFSPAYILTVSRLSTDICY